MFYIFQDDIRRVRRELEKSGAEKGDLTSKIEELNLYNDSSERELKTIIHDKQVNLPLITKTVMQRTFSCLHFITESFILENFNY